MKKFKSCCLSTILILSFLNSFQNVNAQYQMPSKMNWWYEDRFGMFIHFGSYSYLAHGEWAFCIEKQWTKESYQSQVSARFNPVNFNADTIVKMAKMAGMKYIVFTAKHHEGFCMWKTNVSSFKDVTGKIMYDLPDFTEFKNRDILQELKDACDKMGLKFCLYYSILDWNHPSQVINRDNYYSDMQSDSARNFYILDMKAQFKELITKYHPAVIWTDGDWTYNAGPSTLTSWWTRADGLDLYNYLVGLDPNLIVNERVARSFGLGDFECPERKVPEAPLDRQWETCQTINASWGYNASDSIFKSPVALLQELIKVVSRDGNYLLNIGPKGDGSLPVQYWPILKYIGSWIDKNGESVYGCTRSPFSKESEMVYYTKKPDRLYAHIFSWPTEKQLIVPRLKNKINKVYLLDNPTTSLRFVENNENILITLPEYAPDTACTVVVMDVTGLPVSDLKDCTPTSIIPFIQVNGGNWEETSNVIVQTGSNVVLSPRPYKEGTWSWSGPDGSGFKSITREIQLNHILPSQMGSYTATYINKNGCKSSKNFIITVK